MRPPELASTLTYAAPEPLLSGVRDRDEFGVFLFWHNVALMVALVSRRTLATNASGAGALEASIDDDQGQKNTATAFGPVPAHSSGSKTFTDLGGWLIGGDGAQVDVCVDH